MEQTYNIIMDKRYQPWRKVKVKNQRRGGVYVFWICFLSPIVIVIVIISYRNMYKWDDGTIAYIPFTLSTPNRPYDNAFYIGYRANVIEAIQDQTLRRGFICEIPMATTAHYTQKLKVRFR